jgi:hypothetical protein
MRDQNVTSVVFLWPSTFTKFDAVALPTTSMSKLQAAFFFGSGISYPSEMPDVYQITNAARGKWHLGSDGRFSPGPDQNPDIPDDVTPAVQAFLEKVSDCAADYIAELHRPKAGRKPHYEDLFSLAEQAWRPEMDHVPNLVAVEFLRRLRRETASLHCGFKGKSTGDDGFIALARAACDFLHWVVHYELLSVGKTRRGLGLISEVASSVAALDIFTLNHDVLVEEELAHHRIQVEDGFGNLADAGFRVYCSRWWESESNGRKKVRLLKLHGSINWWRYEFASGETQYAIPFGDPFHAREKSGRFANPRDFRAAFLSGTIVKEMHYGEAFWTEQFEAFRSHLAKHTHLICCGYGFGDSGINNKIFQWMSDHTSHRLVILTPDSDEDYFEGKPRLLKCFSDKNRIDIVRDYLVNCKIADLEAYFDPAT